MATLIDLGAIRTESNHIIQLSSYDPYPATGTRLYRGTADNLWVPLTDYKVGDWVLYYPSPFTYLGVWNAGTNSPYLSNGILLSANSIYVVGATGTQDLGAGFVTYRKGDVVAYNGSTWNLVSGTGLTYVCKTAHTSGSVFSNDASKWEQSRLPPYYNLDENSGALYATIPYLPIYSVTFTFYVRIEKYDVIRNQMAFINQLFELTIKGTIDNPIIWLTQPNLGNIYIGYLSELSVAAKHTNTQVTIRYSLVDGELPPGLSLGNDGSIIGRIDYSTSLGQYNFKVRATDIYSQQVEKWFYLMVIEYDGKLYTQIYMKPFLKLESRRSYSIFITDQAVFDRELMYRPEDLNFGVQTQLQCYLEYGTEQVSLADYAQAMTEYFYKKKLWFGNIKSVRADNEFGDHVYDAVYVEIVDPLEKVDGSSTFSGVTIYPNSIFNMRTALESIEVNGDTINTDELQLPRWMRTFQPNTGLTIGYIPVVMLCYALPGNGDKIVEKINDSEFKFNQIDFEVDRLVVNANTSTNKVEYLIFPKIFP